MTATTLLSQHTPASAEVAAALDGNPDTFWTAPAGSHHSTLEVSFSKPVTFNRARHDGVAQRRPAHPEVLHRRLGPELRGRRIAAGEAIGHKKIDIFPPLLPPASGSIFCPALTVRPSANSNYITRSKSEILSNRMQLCS